MIRHLIKHSIKPNGKTSMVWYYPSLEKCEVEELRNTGDNSPMVGSVEFSLYGKEIPSHWLKDIQNECERV